MKFTLEVDLTAGGIPGHEVEELGRILRYWAGNVKHYELAAAPAETIYDSGCSPVGAWAITTD